MESWSGYFRPTDPTGEQTLDVGTDADDAYASVFAQVPRLAKVFRQEPTFFAFYVGRADPRFVSDNVAARPAADGRARPARLRRLSRQA